MATNEKSLYLTINSFRDGVVNRLFPLFIVVSWTLVAVSLSRIGLMGFQPVMLLHVCAAVAVTIIYFIRKRIQADTVALAVVVILLTLFAAGVATFGLLSSSLVVAPMCSLFLVLLGHRKMAFATIAGNILFLAVMAVCFGLGILESPVSPALYVRSPAAWSIMIFIVAASSIAFASPFELVPATLALRDERFRAAFENASIGVCLVNEQGRYLTVNHTLCEMLGYTAEELLKMTTFDVTHPDDRERGPAARERLIAGRSKIESYEKRYVHKQGHVVWAHISTTLLRDPQGNPQHLISHIQDITERKRVEETLRESERRYRLISENAADVIWVMNPATDTFTYVSPSVVKMRGYTPEEVMAQSMSQRLSPESSREISDLLVDRMKVFQRNGSRPISYTDEVDQPCKDGRLIRAEVTTTYFLNERGAIEIIGVTRDITDRKKQAEEIEMLRHSIDVHYDGAYWLDRENRIVYVNDTGARVMGYPREELIGRSLCDVNPEATPEGMEVVWKVLRSEGHFSTETVHRRKDDSEYPVEITTSYVQFGGREYACGFARDISERKRAEEARKKLEGQLFQTQKVESIGTLAAGIAHDFNNILSIILGNASLLSTKSHPDEKTLRRLNAIISATDRGAQLVRQLLTFARKTEVNWETVEVNDVVRDTVKLLDETFPKTIEVAVQLKTGLPAISADVTQLNQVLVNLCVNARDAMPQGGNLTIATDSTPGEIVRKKYAKATAPHYVTLSVADTGTGMDAETRSRMFDPFFTTKEIGKGTGLGLAVVMGIVQNHGGIIDVETRRNAGTTILVHLPAGDLAVVSASEPAIQIDAISGGTETILFVEDEGTARDLVTEILSEKGYTVISASDGEEAVRIFEERSREIALVVSDYGLPKLDGEEVCRRIHRIHPAVPVVIVSGYLDPKERVALTELGVKSVIEKPYKFSELLEVVKRALDHPSDQNSHPY